MTRPIGWAFVIGLVLLAAGLVVSTAAPSAGGEILVIAGAALFAVLVLVATVAAHRSPGWTRVANPGAARREYLAEQAARKREHGGVHAPPAEEAQREHHS
jgi:hypothetical protein